MNKPWEVDISQEEFYQQKKDPHNVAMDLWEWGKAVSIACTLKILDTGPILDVGCGEGLFTSYYQYITGVNVDGIDISRTAIERADEHFTNAFSVWDIRDMPDWGYKSYGVVMLNEVLYYLEPEEIAEVMESVKLFLRSGGYILITCGQYYSKEDVGNILKENGFIIEERTHLFEGCGFSIVVGKFKEVI